MLREFEHLVRQYPQNLCFRFVEDDGSVFEYSYEEARAQAAVLAFLLQKEGSLRGSLVSVDMANCPAFVFLVLAAAYGGFSLAALNHRLTEEEKAERIFELKARRELSVKKHLNEKDAEGLLAQVSFLSDGQPPNPSGLSEKGQAKRPETETIKKGEVFHWLERQAASFDSDNLALMLFTSGTTGRPKIVPQTWTNLCGSAKAFAASLETARQGIWQAALPMYHIGGFQIVVRSIMNALPFTLYRGFDAKRILADTVAYNASNISVVNKMLRDLLTSDSADRLRHYRCILLGGETPNPATLEQAVARKLQVYASYGMTETASLIAMDLVEENYKRGTCALLPGYEARIISPNANGIGQLAVKGPGVFGGYCNAQAAFTSDGFFLTGDTASMDGRRIKVQERLVDMFVSGGENVYPAEIRDKLLRIPAVSDAYVFGAEDAVWGRRPVAMIERSASSNRATCSKQIFAKEVAKSLNNRLSKIYRPRHICVVDSFPRTGVGKPNREALERCYGRRLEVREVRLYHIKQPFKTPIKTARTTLETRESLIVEVVDWAGHTGISECVSFPTDWYLPETLGQDAEILEKHLIPLVLGQVYLHPQEVSVCFDECWQALAYPMAKGALEPALWDLYGKMTGLPLWRLITNEAAGDDSAGFAAERQTDSAEVAAGSVIGILPLTKTVEAVRGAIKEGYRRVKLKIKPGDDLARVRAVRKAFSDVIIVLDANQSYTEDDLETLKALDALGIHCIEEPFDPHRPPKMGELFARLARLQNQLKMSVCLDESLVGPDDFEHILAVPELRSCVLKISKLGGVKPALDFYRQARAQGVEVWMGGMYETGISKYLHAAFQTLPGINLPGDISSSSRYFEHDICDPPFKVENGVITLNQDGYNAGLGCAINQEELNKILCDRRIFRLP